MQGSQARLAALAATTPEEKEGEIKTACPDEISEQQKSKKIDDQ